MEGKLVASSKVIMPPMDHPSTSGCFRPNTAPQWRGEHLCQDCKLSYLKCNSRWPDDRSNGNFESHSCGCI